MARPTRIEWVGKVCTESEASHVVRFVLPVVQGFVEAIPMRVGQSEGHLTLIARRRIQRPGVRHWRRGCDPQVPAPMLS